MLLLVALKVNVNQEDFILLFIALEASHVMIVAFGATKQNLTMTPHVYKYNLSAVHVVHGTSDMGIRSCVVALSIN